MARSYNSHSRTIYLEVDGEEMEFEVYFSIDSFGSADSYYEPGDPAEIVIDEIFRIVRYIGEHEILVTDWAYNKHYSWNVSVTRHDVWRDASDRMHAALFGRIYSGISDKPYIIDTVPAVRVNPQTVAEALETEILENVMDYANDEPDYDYSY